MARRTITSRCRLVGLHRTMTTDPFALVLTGLVCERTTEDLPLQLVGQLRPRLI